MSYDGSLVFMSGWTGIDFGQYAPTDLVRKVETNAIISAVEALSEGDPDRRWTVEELASQQGAGCCDKKTTRIHVRHMLQLTRSCG